MTTKGEALRQKSKLKRQPTPQVMSPLITVIASLSILVLCAGDPFDLLRGDRLAHFFVAFILTKSLTLITPSSRTSHFDAFILILFLGCLKECLDHQWELIDLFMGFWGGLLAVLLKDVRMT